MAGKKTLLANVSSSTSKDLGRKETVSMSDYGKNLLGYQPSEYTKESTLERNHVSVMNVGNFCTKGNP